MIKHVLLAAAIVALGITSFAGTSTPARAQMAGMQNVTGDWMLEVTGEKFMSGTLHLTQVGNTIIGSAEPANGHGVLQMNGTLSNQTWSAKWRSPSGETGWLTAHFNNKGNSFSGQWGFNGRKANGQFVSKRFLPEAF